MTITKQFLQNIVAEARPIIERQMADAKLIAGFRLVHTDGWQIGVEAKMRLNVHVINQVLPSSWGHRHSYPAPDYRAVLVPEGKASGGLSTICERLGITVVTVHKLSERNTWGDPFRPKLPRFGKEDWGGSEEWLDWCPDKRCAVPEYVPDVVPGQPAPVALSKWKIGAIRLVILLDRRGYLTPADFKHFKISPTRWTQSDWLLKGPSRGIWLRGRLPDFKAQHPVNFDEIEADFENWAPKFETQEAFL